MKKLIPVFIIIILISAAVIVYKYSGKKTTTYSNPSAANQINTTTPMTISSTAFSDGQLIPKQYSCDGDGINPPLQFFGIPSEAKSLALLVEDPDAPTGTWTHWLMWNIPPAVSQIAQNSVPQGATQGQGSSGQNVFGAPCPPGGTHRYFFKLFALDGTLTIPSYSDAKAFGQAIDGHVISQAQLMGTYSR